MTGRGVPDDRAWMGSGIGMDGPPARLLIECVEQVHGGTAPRLVRELRRGDNGFGWIVNPDVDLVRDDQTPLDELPAGSPISYRLHLDIRCECGMNVALTSGDTRQESTVSILDALVDGGVQRIALRRLCDLVSNWR